MTKREPTPTRKRHHTTDEGEGPLDILFDIVGDGCLSGCIGLLLRVVFLPIRLVIWIIGSIFDN